jgi:hypothetical protein
MSEISFDGTMEVIRMGVETGVLTAIANVQKREVLFVATDIASEDMQVVSLTWEQVQRLYELGYE